LLFSRSSALPRPSAASSSWAEVVAALLYVSMRNLTYINQ
jgi:hypothetical protein